MNRLYGNLERADAANPASPRPGHRARQLRAVLGLAVAFIACLVMSSPAQQPDVIDREPEIKAAYLYNFGRYVEWPEPVARAADGGRPAFVIGIVGDSPVATPLRSIVATKKIGDRPIELRQFKSEKDYQPCHVLFVPAGQDLELTAAILKKARQTPTLIVGEEDGFSQKRGHISFYPEQNNLKFEINAAAAEQAGLKISSKLLSLGRLVGEKQGN